MRDLVVEGAHGVAGRNAKAADGERVETDVAGADELKVRLVLLEGLEVQAVELGQAGVAWDHVEQRAVTVDVVDGGRRDVGIQNQRHVCVLTGDGEEKKIRKKRLNSHMRSEIFIHFFFTFFFSITTSSPSIKQ